MKQITGIAGYTICSLILCSCGNTDSLPRHGFRTIIENEIPVAVSTGGPKYEGELFRYETLLTLKTDPDNPESLLYRPYWIVQGPRGEYLVCDEGDRRIVAFDSEGQFIRSFGRRGSGPGEFQSIQLLDITNGILTIFDSSLQRTTLFSSTGELLGVYPVGILERTDAMYVLDNGSQLCLRHMIDIRGEEDWRAMRGLIISSNGDTIASIETPYVHRRMWLRRQYNVSYYVYFSSFPYIGYVPDKGLYVYDPSYPELCWFNGNGNPIYSYRIDLPRISPSPQDIALIKDDWSERASSDPSAEMVQQNLAFGDFVPFWNTVLIDADGYCWLSKYEPRSRKEEFGGTAFKVLSPAGEYLGDTRWPFVAFESDHVHRASIAGGLLMAIVPIAEGEEPATTIFRITPIMDGLEYPQSQ